MTTHTLAIDFGTTNSLAGFRQGEKNVLLELDPHRTAREFSFIKKPNQLRDPHMLRSLLYFPHENQVFFGSESLFAYQENSYEGRLFRSFKAHLPNQSYLGTVIGNRRLPLEEMIGLFLLEIKKRSENITGQKFEMALVGRPAKYSMDPIGHGFALHRMEKALQFAGFKEWKFVPEPVAAALHVDRQSLGNEKFILIGDFGGGTSDFTIIRSGIEDFQEKDILAVDGCPVAGDAIESCLMKNRLNKHFGAESKYRLPLGSNILQMPPSIRHRLDVPSHIVHLQEKETFEFIHQIQRCALTEADRKQVSNLITLVEEQLIFGFFEKIEEAKIALSSQDQFDFFFSDSGLQIADHLNRKEFECWSKEVIDKVSESLDRTLSFAQLDPSQIDEVCLTGGTANVPSIKKLFTDRFGPSKVKKYHEYRSVIDGLIEAIK
jgi:hypothetical chaperone protein